MPYLAITTKNHINKEDIIAGFIFEVLAEGKSYMKCHGHGMAKSQVIKKDYLNLHRSVTE